MAGSTEATPHKGQDRAVQVRRIFSEIAPRYDLLNHVLSGGVDRRWRKRAIAALEWERAPGGRYLDVCAGTFDLSAALCRRRGFRGRVVGADFAFPMLVEGLDKTRDLSIEPLCADALNLPFGDATFDGLMVAFGVRNLADLTVGFAEFRRVLKPGARLVVLEFTVPPNPLVRAAYLTYFNHVLPRVGRWVSGHPWAYSYLPASVKEFPGPAGLASLMQQAGLEGADWKLLTGGIAALHTARR